MPSFAREINIHPSTNKKRDKTAWRAPQEYDAHHQKNPEGITPSKVKLNWECEEGHKISKGYGEIQYKGCKHCYRIGQSITYQYAKEVAIAKGYKLVTTPSQFKKLMEQAYKNKVKPNMAKLK